MSDESTVQQPRKGSGLLAYTGMMLALFILYVLSVGPVAMCYKGKGVPNAVEVFYSPLIYTYLNVPLAQQFFDWYFKLWGVDP